MNYKAIATRKFSNYKTSLGDFAKYTLELQSMDDDATVYCIFRNGELEGTGRFDTVTCDFINYL